MDLPILFVVIVAALLCLWVYYLRSPSAVAAGAVIATRETAKATVSFAKGFGLLLMVVVVIGIAFFLLKSIALALFAGGPVAGLLAYLILRDVL